MIARIIYQDTRNLVESKWLFLEAGLHLQGDDRHRRPAGQLWDRLGEYARETN